MKNNILIFIVILLGATSCLDVLEKQPLDVISDEVVWKDPILIDKYLLECYAEMGFYNEMQLGGNHDDVAGNTPFTMTGMSDEAHAAWVPTPKTHWISPSSDVASWWGYYVVRKLNIFLEKMKDSPIQEEISIQRIAEARFLRAFCYFQMVKRYGGVPLITQEVTLSDSEELLYPKREKEETIYRFIIDELNDIIDNKLLKESYGSGDLGRPTIWAAAALKSRAAMYAGSIATWGKVQLDGLVGIPTTEAEYFWKQSQSASDYIIEKGPYELYNKYLNEDVVKNYRQIFIDENNSEIIFSEVFDGKAGKGHSWDHWLNPPGYNAWNEGQGYVVYLEFVESYQNLQGEYDPIDRNKIATYHQWTMEELFGNKDPRFHASIYTHGTKWHHNGNEVTLDYHQGVFLDGTWYESGVAPNGMPAQGLSQTKWRPSSFGILKYLDEDNAMVPERLYSQTDWIIFRLGEILINKAEAAFELGNEPAARKALNQIRRRAGMPEFTEAITREDIRQERKIELAFEGNRYWDLRRWRIAEEVLTKDWSGLRYKMDGTTGKLYLEILPSIAGTPIPYFKEMHYYLPISQWRISQNPNLEQNPLYR